jgi:hypothetical protein
MFYYVKLKNVQFVREKGCLAMRYLDGKTGEASLNISMIIESPFRFGNILTLTSLYPAADAHSETRPGR